MNRVQTGLQRLGGRDAVTWPLFWVSFIASTLFNFAIPPVPIPLSVRMTGLITAQVAMFVPLVALRLGVLNRATRPHPWLTLIAYLVATVIRAYVLGFVLNLLDSTQNVPFASRLQGSLISVFVVLVLTTLVVSTSREHARDQARLLALRTDLIETREALAGQIEQQNEATLARVQSTLANELARLESVGDDEEALAELRRLAGDVVRPMSHELEQSVPVWRPRSTPAITTRVRWSRVFTELGGRGPFLPLATAILITAFVAAGSATYLRERSAAIIVIALAGSVTVLWLANRVLDRVLPLPSASRSLIVLVLVALFASALPAVAVALVSNSATATVLAVAGTFLLAGLALLLALIRQGFETQRTLTAELIESTADLRASLVRLHQTQWYHQRALARALHGSVQTAVVGAAIRLDTAMRDGAVTKSLLDQTRIDLAREVDVLSAKAEQPKPLPVFINGLESVWTRVVTLDIEVGAEVNEMIEDDAVLRAILMEVISELVSNAVRHGHASQVGIVLTQSEERTLELTVASDSTIESGPRRQGLGSRLLDDCTREWHERTTSSGLEVCAIFPAEPTHALV